VQNGAAFDVVITGGSMGGTALTSDYSLYYVLGGGGTVGGERGPVSIGSPLTADGSQYGQSITVQARACRSYDSGALCHDSESGVFSTGLVAVDPRLPNGEQPVFTPTGLGLGSGSFDWLGWPSGPGYESIQYTCDGQGGFTTADTTQPGHCDATGLLTVHLTIRVIANGGQAYDMTYSSN
jgi:hypothetical protein